jgi:hypothetical protein
MPPSRAATGGGRAGTRRATTLADAIAAECTFVAGQTENSAIQADLEARFRRPGSRRRRLAVAPPN